MKNIGLSLLLLFGLLVFTGSVYHSVTSLPLTDTIFIGVAPSTLPEIDGDWEEIAFKTINQKFALNRITGLSKAYLVNKSLKDQLVQIFKDEPNADAFYNWLKPSLLDKWDKTPLKEKVFIKETLSKLNEYLNNYSKEVEDTYLGNNEKNFIFYKSTEYWDDAKKVPYPVEMTDEIRYLEAFLHRRMSDGIKKETLIKYIDLLLGDLVMKSNINYRNDIDGVMLEKFSILEGKKEGEWIFNQQIQYEGKKYILPGEIKNYKNNKKDGEWKEYVIFNSKAEIKTLKKFKNDELIELAIYNYTKEKPVVLEEVITYDIKRKEKVIEKYEDGEVVSTEKMDL